MMPAVTVTASKLRSMPRDRAARHLGLLANRAHPSRKSVRGQPRAQPFVAPAPYAERKARERLAGPFVQRQLSVRRCASTHP